MKFSQFVKSCTQILRDNPEAGDFEVVAASDDEGNSFHKTHYAPQPGHFEGADFTPGADNANSICIN